ncbi:MAG: undecaprenyl-diphosphate phosphatase [Candidatus Dependentiae bacterium]|nr:undecaprenyl-diphosphate phosphatase [Candidatus Dependentiae bacterium]
MVLYIWILMQIIVESLPVSSSGHVILAQKLCEKFGCFSEIFFESWAIDFILHGPTIIILLFYFFKTWWNMVFGQSSIDFKIFLQKSTWQSLVRPLIFIGIADLISIVFWGSGIAQTLFITSYFLPVGFMITATILYGFSRATGSKVMTWNFKDAVILGIVQGLSLLPGISRFASTYGAGRLLCRYDGSTSFALSFLIQLPLIGAGFVKGLVAVQKYPGLMIKLFSFKALLVMVVASLVSYGLLCWIGSLIQKNKIYYFAFYMIIPIVLSLII